jgi:hypothetical protein
MPARVRRELTGEERERIIVSARHYVHNASRYRPEPSTGTD